VIPRPRFKLPLWAAFAIPLAAYLLRSVVVRSGDFSVDALDAIVLLLVASIVAIIGLLRREDRGKQEPSDEHNGEDSATGDER
jgi:hypothetical protein